MTDSKRVQAVGIGMTGSGAVLAAISMLAEGGYWFVVVGSAFILVGIAMLLVSRRMS